MITQDASAARNLVAGQSDVQTDGNISSETTKATNAHDGSDPDLQRAKELVDLHFGIKVKFEEQGPDAELEDLRAKVAKMVAEMDR
jgi:hypothetical protein